MGSLDAQVMLVTRASRGIGEYVALHLARAGAKVTVAARTEEVTDPRLLSTIHSVAQAIAEEGGHIIKVSSGQARLPGR